MEAFGWGIVSLIWLFSVPYIIYKVFFEKPDDIFSQLERSDDIFRKAGLTPPPREYEPDKKK